MYMHVCVCIYINYRDKYLYSFAHLDRSLSNPFMANVLIIYLKTTEIRPLVFWGCQRCGMGAFAKNGSITVMVHGM